MQRLEVSGAVRPVYESLGVKRLSEVWTHWLEYCASSYGPGVGFCEYGEEIFGFI